jgi:hypothetical protein
MRKNFLPWTDDAFELLRQKIMNNLEQERGRSEFVDLPRPIPMPIKVEEEVISVITPIKDITPITIKQSKLYDYASVFKPHTIEIDLLDGLTENQKHMIRGLVATGQYSPMGFTVNTNTSDVWYMGKIIARCI